MFVMTIFLVRARTQPKEGKVYEFWQLRENYWDKAAKATRQRHIAYIGKEPRLTLAKAKAICREKGLKLDDLKAVKGLEIIDG